MPIRAISRGDFEKFKPARHPILSVTIDEVEWFADDDGVVIGVLARDKSDKDWSIAALGRDERGEFRMIDGAVSIANQDDARTELKAKMEKALASGDKMFPQGDDGPWNV
jgi:hypothetical protein